MWTFRWFGNLFRWFDGFFLLQILLFLILFLIILYFNQYVNGIGPFALSEGNIIWCHNHFYKRFLCLQHSQRQQPPFISFLLAIFMVSLEKEKINTIAYWASIQWIYVNVPFQSKLKCSYSLCMKCIRTMDFRFNENLNFYLIWSVTQQLSPSIIGFLSLIKVTSTYYSSSLFNEVPQMRHKPKQQKISIMLSNNLSKKNPSKIEENAIDHFFWMVNGILLIYFWFL